MRMVDISGKRFGKLTATNRIPSKRTKSGNLVTFWAMRCDCGKETFVSFSNIRSGRVASCGTCVNPVNSGKGSTDAGIRQIEGWYKIRAKRKDKEYALTREELSAIISKNCTYCGDEPSNTARGDSKYSRTRYSGIDRIDSTKGYITGNVVPCCGICNTMKGALSVDDFLYHIRKIHYLQFG